MCSEISCHPCAVSPHVAFESVYTELQGLLKGRMAHWWLIRANRRTVFHHYNMFCGAQLNHNVPLKTVICMHLLVSVTWLKTLRFLYASACCAELPSIISLCMCAVDCKWVYTHMLKYCCKVHLIDWVSTTSQSAPWLLDTCGNTWYMYLAIIHNQAPYTIISIVMSLMWEKIPAPPLFFFFYCKQQKAGWCLGMRLCWCFERLQYGM